MALEDIEIDDQPLEIRPRKISFPTISDEMVASLALGMEDDLVVASRHGISVEDFAVLNSKKWFQLRVQAKRAEFDRDGITFKAKAAWMAGDLLDQVYMQAASANASLNQKHDVLKTLVKVGGLEPKEEKEKQELNLPTIIINGGTVSLSGGATPSEPLTIDVP
jgi:hypothetical protein